MAKKKKIERGDWRTGSGGFMSGSKLARPKKSNPKLSGAKGERLKPSSGLGSKLAAEVKLSAATPHSLAATPTSSSSSKLKKKPKPVSVAVPPPIPASEIENKETELGGRSSSHASARDKFPIGSDALESLDDGLVGGNDSLDGDADGSARRRAARRRPAGPVRERIAANDDVPSIGGLIYALQQKPSFDSFKYAAAGSVIWALLGLGFGWFSLSSEIAAGGSFSQLLANPATFLTLAGTIVPIAIIWFLAVLAWRAEELRLRSSTMTEVAMRLAEPDRLAEQSVASLGQAVRRQVSFMNDAVSRALGRAGELEALVHNEVASLENSYEDNERKIRGLINELAAERSALAGTGGDFADTLRMMGDEVPALIEKLSGQQSKLAGIIASAGDNLTSLESSLETSADRLEGSLESRTSQLQVVIEGYTGAIDTALGSRTEEMRTMLEDHTGAIDASMSKQSGQMDTMLLGHSTEMGEAVGKHVGDMRDMLGEQTTALQDTLGTRTESMRNLLGDYTTALAEALGSRTDQMEGAFNEHLEALDSSIELRTDNLQTVFEEYGRALDSTLANRADALDAQLIERTRALDNAFNQRLQLFDDSIVRSTKQIDKAVGDKALALTSALDSHSTTFRETISQQAADLDESLVHGINAVRRSSENITRQSLKAIEGLAGQSDLLKNVSDNLLGQINTVSNRFDTQSQSIMSAANALESANFKIDTTLRSRHSDLSQTLDSLSGKADEFSEFIEGYSTSIAGSLVDAETRARATAEELKTNALSQQQTVIADINRLHTDAGEQSSRALEDLRKQFSSVSEELESQLGSLSSTVDETTEGLRKQTSLASSQIASEQERLKAELASIPSATREGSETMRRALQDQLKALERLTDISQSHTKGHEVSSPVAPTAPLASPLTVQSPSSSVSSPSLPDSEKTGASKTDRGLSSLSSSVARELASRGHPQNKGPGSSSLFQGEAATAGHRSNNPVGPGRADPGPAGASQPALEKTQLASGGLVPGATGNPAVGSGRARVRAAPGAPVPATGGTPRDGWSLGDLLHRASFDEVEGGAGQSTGNSPATGPVQGKTPTAPLMPAGGGPLEAGTAAGTPQASGGGIDIGLVSRAILPQTASQVWQRLRAGQRGFLSRDIYTPEGRIVFDDIGYRFKSDSAVNASVLSFLSDFENSLRNTEKADASGQQVQAQLMSEPGRVYLFLAHVSGRLG